MDLIVAADKVLQKLLQTRREIIDHVQENVDNKEKNELSELDKKKAQHIFDQHALLLEPTKIVRGVRNRTKWRHQNKYLSNCAMNKIKYLRKTMDWNIGNSNIQQNLLYNL